jgi:type II secretion system protein I
MTGRRRRSSGGFTLLEVLVATTIMAVAVATLLAALSTSLSNAGRVTSSDRAAIIAKRLMDDLIAAPVVVRGEVLHGRFDERATGLSGGWRAVVEPFEPLPGQPPGGDGIDRIALELWWNSGPQTRTFRMEGYRRASLPEGRRW